MLIRGVIIAFTFMSLSWVAHADPAKVAPPHWQKSEKGDLTIYQSPSKREVMVFRIVDDVSDPALAVSMISGGLTEKAERIVSDRAYSDGGLTIKDTIYHQRGLDMHVRVFGIRRTDGVFQAMAHMAPATEAGLGDRMLESAEKMKALAGAHSAPQSEPDVSPAPPSETLSGVKTILFDLSYKYGVGGAAYPVYHPVVLYADGVAIKPGSTAIDEINLAEFQSRSPKSVGRWRQAGAKYEVTWTGKAKTDTLSAKVGPPKALPRGHKLSGSYQMLGGGGNIAFGGGTMTVQAKAITFSLDGRFSFSDKRGASSGAGVGGSKRNTSGTWSLDGTTLALNFDRGDTIRMPVFYSASRKSSSDFGRYGVLWIGGKNYKRIE